LCREENRWGSLEAPVHGHSGEGDIPDRIDDVSKVNAKRRTALRFADLPELASRSTDAIAGDRF
jgi:hypothetical protein